MRVLYLTMNPNRASTTVPTEGWFRTLGPVGLRPVLVSRETGALDQWAREQGIAAHHVPMPVPAEFTTWTLAAALWRLLPLVLRYRVQIIHCNEQDIYPVGSYLARLCRVPVVVSVHFTMERRFCEWAFRAKRNPMRVFFVSAGNREACRPGMQGVVPEDRWRVLPNGLDLQHFVPDRERGDEFRRQHDLTNQMVVGVACALRPRKQLEHLVGAAVLQDSGVRVVIAGAPVHGDEAYASELLNEARARLGDRLLVLGHLDELRGFYNALDVFVNTSQEEACSISVIEALACGCPVLGYPSKSVDGQILPDGGEIVPQDDIGALGGALHAWLSDREGLSARRTGARRTAEERFDARELSLQLWREYEELLRRD